MQNVNPIIHLTNLLSKNNFETKEVEKNKILIALKKNQPRFYFEVNRKWISVKVLRELNDKAIKESDSLISNINQLNQNTILSKYYLQSDSKLCSEARLLKIENETELATIMNILKYDMKQLLIKNKSIRKYILF